MGVRGAGTGTGAFAFAFAFAGAVIFGNYTLSITLLLFWALFPLLNALYDFLSLRVSRYYLHATQREDSAFFILGDILVDLLIAIVFMLALAIVLPGVTEWVNAIYSQFDPKAVVDWRRYAQDAIDEPFGKGLMVTAMLITTLLPTLVHIFLGLFAFTISSLFGKKLASFLKDVGDSSLKASIAAIWLQAYLFFVIALLIGLYYGLHALLDLPFDQWLYSVAENWHDNSWLVVCILLLLTLAALNQPIWQKLKELLKPPA